MIRCRALQASDVTAVAAIEAGAFSRPWTEATLAHLCTLSYVHGEIAEDDTQVAGFALVSVAGAEADLLTIAVDSHHQQRGIGTQLLQSLCAWCRAEGVLTLFLEVRAGHYALAWYQRQGFVVVGRRREYYRDPVEDALVMQCAL